MTEEVRALAPRLQAVDKLPPGAVVTLQGCEGQYRVRANGRDLEQMLENVWNAMTAPPEYMVMDRRTGETFRMVSEEEQRRREVCTPKGLGRLFPGLRERT